MLIARWKSEANFRRREALYDLSGRVWGCNNILLFSVGVWDGTALCLFGIMSKFIRSQKDFVHIWVLWTMYDARDVILLFGTSSSSVYWLHISTQELYS